MALPSNPTGNSIATYRHAHIHTGAGETALNPPAKAFMVINQSGAITLTLSDGSTFDAQTLPTATVIPLEFTNITLAQAADDVLLLY